MLKSNNETKVKPLLKQKPSVTFNLKKNVDNSDSDDDLFIQSTDKLADNGVIQMLIDEIQYNIDGLLNRKASAFIKRGCMENIYGKVASSRQVMMVLRTNGMTMDLMKLPGLFSSERDFHVNIYMLALIYVLSFTKHSSNDCIEMSENTFNSVLQRVFVRNDGNNCSNSMSSDSFNHKRKAIISAGGIEGSVEVSNADEISTAPPVMVSANNGKSFHKRRKLHTPSAASDTFMKPIVKDIFAIDSLDEVSPSVSMMDTLSPGITVDVVNQTLKLPRFTAWSSVNAPADGSINSDDVNAVHSLNSLCNIPGSPITPTVKAKSSQKRVLLPSPVAGNVHDLSSIDSQEAFQAFWELMFPDLITRTDCSCSSDSFDSYSVIHPDTSTNSQYQQDQIQCLFSLYIINRFLYEKVQHIASEDITQIHQVHASSRCVGGGASSNSSNANDVDDGVDQENVKQLKIDLQYLWNYQKLLRNYEGKLLNNSGSNNISNNNKCSSGNTTTGVFPELFKLIVSDANVWRCLISGESTAESFGTQSYQQHSQHTHQLTRLYCSLGLLETACFRCVDNELAIMNTQATDVTNHRCACGTVYIYQLLVDTAANVFTKIDDLVYDTHAAALTSPSAVKHTGSGVQQLFPELVGISQSQNRSISSVDMWLAALRSVVNMTYSVRLNCNTLGKHLLESDCIQWCISVLKRVHQWNMNLCRPGDDIPEGMKCRTGSSGSSASAGNDYSGNTHQHGFSKALSPQESAADRIVYDITLFILSFLTNMIPVIKHYIHTDWGDRTTVNASVLQLIDTLVDVLLWQSDSFMDIIINTDSNMATHNTNEKRINDSQHHSIVTVDSDSNGSINNDTSSSGQTVNDHDSLPIAEINLTGHLTLVLFQLSFNIPKNSVKRPTASRQYPGCDSNVGTVSPTVNGSLAAAVCSRLPQGNWWLPIRVLKGYIALQSKTGVILADTVYPVIEAIHVLEHSSECVNEDDNIMISTLDYQVDSIITSNSSNSNSQSNSTAANVLFDCFMDTDSPSEPSSNPTTSTTSGTHLSQYGVRRGFMNVMQSKPTSANTFNRADTKQTDSDTITGTPSIGKSISTDDYAKSHHTSNSNTSPPLGAIYSPLMPDTTKGMMRIDYSHYSQDRDHSARSKGTRNTSANSSPSVRNSYQSNTVSKNTQSPSVRTTAAVTTPPSTSTTARNARDTGNSTASTAMSIASTPSPCRQRDYSPSVSPIANPVHDGTGTSTGRVSMRMPQSPSSRSTVSMSSSTTHTTHTTHSSLSEGGIVKSNRWHKKKINSTSSNSYLLDNSPAVVNHCTEIKKCAANVFDFE